MKVDGGQPPMGTASTPSVRALRVSGAWEIRPPVFTDDRGLVAVPFRRDHLAALGVPSLDVAQTVHSRSRRGTVRGVHYTRGPSGGAKYVHCAHGSALDIVVDLRTGSPTFGLWDTVSLDPSLNRSVYVPAGVGHAFVALEPDTVLTYLLSTPYASATEGAVDARDPRLGLPLDRGDTTLMSARDRRAPTLDEAVRQGLLTVYEP